MATFNGAEFLSEQIESILVQLGPDDELIISDDGSVDETLPVISTFHDKRIRKVLNNGMAGYSSNFCNAIDHAKGDIIFLSDQDDVWMPNKVKSCLMHLDNVDFVVHDAMVVDSNLVDLGYSYFNYRKVKKGFFNNFIKIGYLGCCMAFRREVLFRSNPMPLKPGVITHDSWLTLIAELYYKVAIIDESLIMYRRHSNNVSNGGASEGNNFFVKIYIRFFTLLKLIIRR